MGSYRDRFLNCTYCRMRGGPLTGVDGLGVLCQTCLEWVRHNFPQALPGNTRRMPRYRRMPAASDEDIARRQCHRHASIAAVRRSPDYVEVQLRSATGTLGSNIPEPPDPEDMRKSKRTWETNMQWWRRALKALATWQPHLFSLEGQESVSDGICQWWSQS